jgi:hypothetical protein
MSLTLFLAFCILGLDFMIYVLFKWTYGEKRRSVTRLVAEYRNEEQASRPFLIHSQKTMRHAKSNPRDLRLATTHLR